VIEPPHHRPPRRESHYSDGITDQKSLQRTSATKSATNGLVQRSKKKPLLDNLVGAQLEFAAYRELKRLRSLEIDD
jgi:hypothetical protein